MPVKWLEQGVPFTAHNTATRKEGIMGTINVQLLKLEAMCVASAYGFGANPEEQAWETPTGL